MALFQTVFFKIYFCTDGVDLPEHLTESVLRSLARRVCDQTLKLMGELVPMGMHDYNCGGLLPLPGELGFLCSLSGREFDWVRVSAIPEADEDEEDEEDEEGAVGAVGGDGEQEESGEEGYSESDDGDDNSVESRAKNVLLYYTALDPNLRPHELVLCDCLRVEEVENEFDRY